MPYWYLVWKRHWSYVHTFVHYTSLLWCNELWNCSIVASCYFGWMTFFCFWDDAVVDVVHSPLVCQRQSMKTEKKRTHCQYACIAFCATCSMHQCNVHLSSTRLVFPPNDHTYTFDKKMNRCSHMSEEVQTLKPQCIHNTIMTALWTVQDWWSIFFICSCRFLCSNGD